jgi:integrase
MPRSSKGARLYLEGAVYQGGKLRKRASWIIRDGTRRIRTGCAAQDRDDAERALGEYIASKYRPDRKRHRHPAEILIADVLNIYLQDVAPEHRRPDETKQRCLTLDSWWADRTLGDVNGKTCRDYVKWRVGQQWKSAKPNQTGNTPKRVTKAAARRELEDLRAAINHHRREGLCSEIVEVVLPKKAGTARDRWLTRGEAARLLWAAWRARQVMRDNVTRRPTGRHLARFILVGLYTGTRHAAICSAAVHPAIDRGYVDLDRGVFHRRASSAGETKKRQPPARLPDRLLAHLRRWERLGIAKQAVVEWNGKPVRSVRKAFAAAVNTAGLEGKITPHILRHTAATWAMQAGGDLWSIAGFLGMTVEMLERVYGHHHPDFQRDAAEAVSSRPKRGNVVRLTRA